MQLHWIAQRFTPLSLLDILVVTAAIFWFLLLVQGTRGDQVLRGIVLLVVAIYLLSTLLDLTLLSWLLQRSVPALLFAIPVIFQAELRRAFEQLGRSSHIVGHPLSTLAPVRSATANAQTEHTVDIVVDACARLARDYIGALIVLERRTGLQDYARSGVRLASPVSADFLVYIFQHDSPLHDGAVIIHGDQIVAAGCVLPLSENLPGGELGTRHRAGLGLSEVTDALAVIVSEETGTISLASAGRLIKPMTGDRLRRVLGAFLDQRGPQRAALELQWQNTGVVSEPSGPSGPRQADQPAVTRPAKTGTSRM